MAEEKKLLSSVKIKGETHYIKDADARDNISQLQTDLQTEITNRQNGDTTNANAIQAEALVRATADATLDTKITNEATRATDAESALREKIENLEARGRFLSIWRPNSAEPDTFPEIPSGATIYTYQYKSGDYYIIESVDNTSPKWRPKGSAITWDSSNPLGWTIPSEVETEELGTGDYYTFDGVSWVLISNSQKTISFANVSGSPYDNNQLSTALNSKVNKTQKIAGIAYGSGDISTEQMQEALGLGEMAYSNTASGTVKPTGTVSQVNITPSGDVTINALKQTPTSATITRASYTPSGNINVTSNPTGDVVTSVTNLSVTLKDESTSSDVTNITYGSYAPKGVINIDPGLGPYGNITYTGTNRKSNVTITPSTNPVVTALKNGTVDAASIDTTKFNGGAVASLKTGFYTPGSDASLTGGAPAVLTQQTTNKFVKKAYDFAMGTGTESECLIIAEVSNTDTNYFSDAVTDRGTFTPNTVPTIVGGKASVIDTTKFDGGSVASINEGFFSANKLPIVDSSKNVNAWTGYTSAEAAAQEFVGDTVHADWIGTAENIVFTGAKYKKQTINTATIDVNKATLSFAGDESQNVVVSEVTYDKATANGGSFTGKQSSVTPTVTINEATVTVSPD